MVADIGAREKELVMAAMEGNLKFPSYIDVFAYDQNLDALRQFILEHPMILSLGSRSHSYNYPNEFSWREAAQTAFAELQDAQMSREGVMRNRRIVDAAKSVAQIEKMFLVSGGAVPGLVKSSSQGKIDIQAKDQVVIADANVTVKKLNEKLAEFEQCLPMVMDEQNAHFAMLSSHMSLQSAISLNLPHGLDAQCGSWRDWILGMTVMLSDGSVVKSGSQVVKNVAGYDAHKLFVGARGTLGMILGVTLKTFPRDALPKHAVEVRRRLPAVARDGYKWPTVWIQRTMASDFQEALQAAEGRILEIDWASSTLWADVPYEEELPRYKNDWVMRRQCGEKNVQISDPTTMHFMKRAKQVLDPLSKFNPGAMGCV